MDIFRQAPLFGFRTKTLGEEFLRRLREMAYKIDVVTVNDILKDRGEPVVPEGHHYGYDRKTIRKLKLEKNGSLWQVQFPLPGRMVRDGNGYWTAEETDIFRFPKTGG